MLVELKQIHKVYGRGRAQVNALAGVDLEVERGEFVSIMGPSGSGKSTLLNVLGCLDQPTDGEYILAGEAVAGLDEYQLARLRNRVLGFVFQEFHLLATATALANVEMPLVYRGLGASERRERAAEALESVGLADRLDHRPGELSGGQQQRVAIARAIAGTPQVILADEPTGNLDTRTSEEIMALFQELHEEHGLTVIQVTHEPDMARHGQRLVVMRDGLLQQDHHIDNRLNAKDVLDTLNQESREGVPS